jgi:hypothetical protein
MLTRRTAIAAAAAMPLATPAAASSDNPAITRLLEQVVAAQAAWQAADLDAFADGPGDSPRAVELDRRIAVTYALVRQLLAIPAQTGGDWARKILAVDVFEEGDWEGGRTDDDTLLSALLADARALAGDVPSPRRRAMVVGT